MVTLSAAVEDPLAESPDEHGMGQPGERPIEPQVQRRDGGGLNPVYRVQRSNGGPAAGIADDIAHTSPGEGNNHEIERELGAVIQLDSADSAVFPVQAGNGCFETNADTLLAQPPADVLAIEHTQGDAGDLYPVGPARCKKPIHEDLARGCERGVSECFAQSADEHHGPELFDRPLRLALAPGSKEGSDAWLTDPTAEPQAFATNNSLPVLNSVNNTP